MKREIKFRAWDKEQSWSDRNRSQEHKMIHSEDWSGGFWGDVILEGSEFEIMQFTGLTDKNGVEIYEGYQRYKLCIWL